MNPSQNSQTGETAVEAEDPDDLFVLADRESDQALGNGANGRRSQDHDARSSGFSGHESAGQGDHRQALAERGFRLPSQQLALPLVLPLVLLAGLLLTMILGVNTISVGSGESISESMLEVQRALAERRAALLQNCVVLLSALLGGASVYYAMQFRSGR